ncbi:MAG: hypothetical protein U9N07_03050 [Euryarchaeota archaeon]|nr:hypothetical protein [Euryarchaeota archaeon]
MTMKRGDVDNDHSALHTITLGCISEEEKQTETRIHSLFTAVLE